MNVLILHYTHPEGYPPTLNAINSIAKKVKKVTVISTNTLPTKWKYNNNVNLILLNNKSKYSAFSRITAYFNYTYSIYYFLKKEPIDLLLIYDNVPFFLYTLTSFFIKKKFKIWYHNHDVYPLSNYKKYSLLWFSAVTERKQKYFNKIDYFSLPAIERKKMYPLANYSGKFFFIPNYPSKKIIKTPINDKIENKNLIQIIYPGNPSHKNGFKELIDVMHQKVNKKTITLTMVGTCHTNFKKELLKYAEEKNVKNQIFFHDRISYLTMSNFLKPYQIGWAVYKPIDLSVATAGSSSNKIYEFLANGLPIMVYDNKHHRNYLNNCNAVFFTDLSPSSILKEIKEIDLNLIKYSKLAINEFELKYQFEFLFEPIFDEIINDINK